MPHKILPTRFNRVILENIATGEKQELPFNEKEIEQLKKLLTMDITNVLNEVRDYIKVHGQGLYELYEIRTDIKNTIQGIKDNGELFRLLDDYSLIKYNGGSSLRDINNRLTSLDGQGINI